MTAAGWAAQLTFALALVLTVVVAVLWARMARAEKRLAETRIDLFALVDLLGEWDIQILARGSAPTGKELHERLLDTFPHLYDVDERVSNERLAARYAEKWL